MNFRPHILVVVAVFLSSCGGGGDSGPSNADLFAEQARLANDHCDGATFKAPSDTPYVLPWQPGDTNKMVQGNCSNRGQHKDVFAYDFVMNWGDPIYASLGGTVDLVVDHFSDDDHQLGHGNKVYILHDNGTMMWYVHIMQGSATVTVGQRVAQGDLLALTGNSGNSAFPHLHMQLYRDKFDLSVSNTIPIAFKNANGVKINGNELVEGQDYLADPY